MADLLIWDSVRSRSWSKWVLIVGGLWAAAGWLVVPFVIRSAFEGGLFGFLGSLMPGSDVHAVDVYLAYWSGLVVDVAIGLVFVWAGVLFLMQPLFWRVLRSAYLRIPTLSGRFERRTVALVLALVSVTFAMQIFYVPGAWETARGHEYQRIATSLSAGEGFSFPPTLRWLYEDGTPGDDEYGTTAWKEPIYPTLIAASFSAFGPRYGRLAVVLVQLSFLVTTCVLIYLLGSRLLGPGAGVAAALLTIARPDLHHLLSVKMQVPAISSLFLVAVLILLLQYGEKPGTRKAVLLGVTLGIAALSHAVLLVMIPIAGLFIFLHTSDRSGWTAVRPALLMCAVALLTISPWTVRNYVHFGHVIPVQTGFGLFANVSNSFLAETYMSDLDSCGDGSPPVYEAAGRTDALRIFLEDERTINTVHRRTVACVAAGLGTAYHDLNEHERDGVHREQVVGFAAAHPLEFIKLTATKGLMYVFDYPVRGQGSTPLAAFGIAGMILLARRPGMWVFPVAILAYATPFAVGAPMYFRYQAPLEPVYSLFAAILFVMVLRRPAVKLKSAWHRWGADS
jgi:uncharacterized protein YjeT (DUF2065 family)